MLFSLNIIYIYSNFSVMKAKVEGAVYLMVVELLSGHTGEGLNAAMNLLGALQYIQEVDALGYVPFVLLCFLLCYLLFWLC